MKVKVPVHVTLDAENMAAIDKLIEKGTYRNRSHALDEAVKLLLKRQVVKL